MLLADSFRGHFGITLSKQILRDQPLHMSGVARYSLYMDSMRWAAHPVLTIPTPIAKDFLVDLVFWSRLSSVNSCSCSARRGQSS